jgi:hypothetical protein
MDRRADAVSYRGATSRLKTWGGGAAVMRLYYYSYFYPWAYGKGWPWPSSTLLNTPRRAPMYPYTGHWPDALIVLDSEFRARR